MFKEVLEEGDWWLEDVTSTTSCNGKISDFKVGWWLSSETAGGQLVSDRVDGKL